MSAEIVVQQSAALEGARERLAARRGVLAGREAQVEQVRARLKVFDQRYLRLVGVLYAELDELEARIAEREVDLYDSDAARRRAAEARARAQETQEAAASGELEPEEFEAAPGLKSLFREVARRIHPDFAADAAEGAHFTLLMARANLAYSRGDAEALQRMLDDRLELHADEGAAAEMLRVLRQIGHVERDLAALEAEEALLLGSELGQLAGEAELAAAEGRDLVAELAASLRVQIADAEYRFSFVDRQITAQVK